MRGEVADYPICAIEGMQPFTHIFTDFILKTPEIYGFLDYCSCLPMLDFELKYFTFSVRENPLNQELARLIEYPIHSLRTERTILIFPEKIFL